jgi:hypothetical protein
MGWMTVIQFVGEIQIFFLDTIFRVAIRILPVTCLLDFGGYFPKVEIRRHDYASYAEFYNMAKKSPYPCLLSMWISMCI